MPSPSASGPAAKPKSAAEADAEARPVFGREASGSNAAAAPGTSGPFRAASSTPSGGDAKGAGGVDEATAPTRRGGLSLVAAGIVGGVVVLVGAGVLQYAGVLPAPGSSADPGEPAGLAELRGELAALRDQVAAGGTGTGAGADPAQTARLEELSGALDQVRTDLAGLRSAVSQGEGGDAAGLQALDQRMTELEASVASLGQAGGAGGGETVDLAPLTDRIGAVEGRVTELARTAQAASDAVSGLPDRIAALDERMAAIDGRVTDLSARLEEQASNPRIALAIAAAGLKAAIDRGDPFMTELETYASIAPDAPGIAELRDLAASGVPTRAAISQAANAAANRMIAAAAPAADDAGFFGRLLDSMQSVVKVRPIGDVEGDDVGAIVARLEAAVRAGDYDRAITEYESLPEAARQAGAGFIADVRARQSADTLVERALAGALRPQEG
ncbi:COG4223 family protein [Aquibium microcysteis]|uniref:COG4223 family protein n=1 Tax=Aquibium microcysteis TaxID=675281 RepID=UPI00165D0A83|nr:mitofilin family membrane protein [Aquibium microcysteis]